MTVYGNILNVFVNCVCRCIIKTGTIRRSVYSVTKDNRGVNTGIRHNIKSVIALSLIILFHHQEVGALEKITPLMVSATITVGQTTNVVLSNGEQATLTLRDARQIKDGVYGAMRRAELEITVNGEDRVIGMGVYNLPQSVGGVQIDCPFDKRFNRFRFRLWPHNSPFIRRGTFVYPVKARWFSSLTQMCGETAFVNKEQSSYIHYAHDIGGFKDITVVVAAADALVVGIEGKVLSGYESYGNSFVSGQKRGDRFFLLDGRGWIHKHSHLSNYMVQLGDTVRAGQEVATLSTTGSSGGWPHVHYELRIFPENEDAPLMVDDAYPYLMQAYIEQHNPQIIAVARPHQVVRVGEEVILNAGKSLCRRGTPVYSWRFHDGSRAQGAVQKRTYSEVGNYSELVRVSNEYGDFAFDFTIVAVHPQDEREESPLFFVASKPAIGIQPGEEVTFYYNVYHTRDWKSFLWDYGDGSKPDTLTNHSGHLHHTYTRSGHYIVTVYTLESDNPSNVPFFVQVGEQSSDVATGTSDMFLSLWTYDKKAVSFFPHFAIPPMGSLPSKGKVYSLRGRTVGNSLAHGKYIIRKQ